MKRQITFLVVAMLFSVASALAQGGTTGPLTWNLNSGTLTISGTGAMPDYNYGGAPWYEYRESIGSIVMETGVATIGDYAFYGCSSLTSIIIPNSVTTIGDYAFSYCTSLTSVTIPNSVTTIGDYAFSACTSMTSVTIPNSVTTIGGYAFHFCVSLTSVTISNSVTTIGDYAFSYCTSLTAVTIPNSVTTIGDYAFQLCTSLTAVTIPNSVTWIGNGTFNSCTSLTSVTISNSVTTIGMRAFYSCTSLTSVTIPNSVTTIGESAFSECTSLTAIDVESGNNSYASENGVLFDKSKTILICCPAGKTTYIIPNSVITIGENAFLFCTILTTITIPNSVTTIGGWAFYYCTSLTAVTIPNSVTTIGEGAFYYCTSLTLITNLNLVPIAIESNVFEEIDISKCTLTVATSAVSAYEKAEVWKDFKIVGGGFLVNPISGDSEQGYTIGDGLYGGRATATIEAIANSGYHFVNWTKNGAEVSRENPYNFTVTEDVELVANFAEGVGIVETNNYQSVRVYPNPTSGELQITNYELRTGTSTGSASNNYNIFNVTGQLITEGRLQDEATTINVESLASGIYFLKIAEKAVKFVKE